MSAQRDLTVDEARRLGHGSAHLDADPTYARRFVRHVSPYVSWLVVTRTPLSADAVTTLSIVSGIVGGLLVAPGTAGTSVAAVLLLQVAYLLDVADGEVARIRGTAGKRGTYLDLIGHFLQNRALYAGASLSLVAVAGGATWAIVVGLVVMGFSVPFGLYAREHVVRSAGNAAHPDHAARATVTRTGAGLWSWLSWGYRRLSFAWNYPASMNLFCIALLADALVLQLGRDQPIAVPVLIALFGVSLAAKQTLHALRLLANPDW
jgi:phosphatidylglycerophosphate synthase